MAPKQKNNDQTPVDLERIYSTYLKWKARPMSKTGPQTEQEFADHFKVTLPDLIAFIELPSYQDDLLLASLTWAKSKTPELLHIVYNEVKMNKSVNDLEKFIQIAHEIKKKDKDDKTVNNFNFFANLKDEQLSLIHISEPTRRHHVSRMPSSA